MTKAITPTDPMHAPPPPTPAPPSMAQLRRMGERRSRRSRAIVTMAVGAVFATMLWPSTRREFQPVSATPAIAEAASEQQPDSPELMATVLQPHPVFVLVDPERGIYRIVGYTIEQRTEPLAFELLPAAVQRQVLATLQDIDPPSNLSI